MKCPKCNASKGQVKNSLNKSGGQKYRCQECGTVYTPDPHANGYPAETRLLAIRMYVEGSSHGSFDGMSVEGQSTKCGQLGECLHSQAAQCLAACAGENYTFFVNSEFLAEEIVRTLVGSLGLIAAVPISTLIATVLIVYQDRLGEWRALLGPITGDELGHTH